jgi:hypothetical protein
MLQFLATEKCACRGIKPGVQGYMILGFVRIVVFVKTLIIINGYQAFEARSV